MGDSGHLKKDQFLWTFLVRMGQRMQPRNIFMFPTLALSLRSPILSLLGFHETRNSQLVPGFHYFLPPVIREREREIDREREKEIERERDEDGK